jgi:hypothetical protein
LKMFLYIFANAVMHKLPRIRNEWPRIIEGLMLSVVLRYIGKGKDARIGCV